MPRLNVPRMEDFLYRFNARTGYPLLERAGSPDGKRFVSISGAIACTYRRRDGRDHVLGLLAVMDSDNSCWYQTQEGILITVSPDAIVSIAPAKRVIIATLPPF